MTETKTVAVATAEQRIEIIQHRLDEYNAHKNDPYTYYEEEIDAVRELRLNAHKDIKFLLEQLKK